MEPPAKCAKLSHSEKSESGSILFSRLINNKICFMGCFPKFFFQSSNSEVVNLFGSNGNMFRSGDVMELSGPPGSGKSTFLLAIVASCLMPKLFTLGGKKVNFDGPELSVLYIDCDIKFSVMRLVSLLEHIILDRLLSLNNSSYDPNIIAADMIEESLKRFSFVTSKSSNELLAILKRVEYFVKKGLPIQLICIDSISAYQWLHVHSSLTKNANMKHVCEEQEELLNCIGRLSHELNVSIIFTCGVSFGDKSFFSDCAINNYTGLPLRPWNEIVSHKVVLNRSYKNPTAKKDNQIRVWIPSHRRNNKLIELPSRHFVFDRFLIPNILNADSVKT